VGTTGIVLTRAVYWLIVDIGARGEATLSRLWSFLGKKGNREILAWICGGLATVLVGLWTVFTYVFPLKQEAGGGPPPSIRATSGGVAIGGNVTGTTINTSGPLNPQGKVSP